MTEFILHVVGEMENHLQRCVICGHAIIDERGTLCAPGSPASTGYAPGPVSVSTGSPRITTIADMSERYKVTPCK